MRMSVLFALTCLFSAFNLVFMPFHPVMMLWAFGLSAAFVIVNIIADRLRLWSGIAWGIAAAVIVASMLIRTFAIVAAIELDDASHLKKHRVRRDILLEEVLRQAGIPLLRDRDAEKLVRQIRAFLIRRETETITTPLTVVRGEYKG